MKKKSTLKYKQSFVSPRQKRMEIPFRINATAVWYSRIASVCFTVGLVSWKRSKIKRQSKIKRTLRLEDPKRARHTRSGRREKKCRRIFRQTGIAPARKTFLANKTAVKSRKGIRLLTYRNKTAGSFRRRYSRPRGCSQPSANISSISNRNCVKNGLFKN